MADLEDFRFAESVFTVSDVSEAARHLQTEVFEHLFVDKGDTKDVLGADVGWPGVQYAFFREPTEAELSVIQERPLPAEAGVCNWLMFAAGKEVGVVFTPVGTGLGFGSKPGALAYYVTAKYGEVLFIAAGQVRPIGPYKWQYNFVSVPFMRERRDELGLMTRDHGMNRDAIKRIENVLNGGHVFVTKQFQRLYPFHTFALYDMPFPAAPPVPFKAILETGIQTPDEFPLILPWDGRTRTPHFSMASATLAEFSKDGAFGQGRVHVNASAAGRTLSATMVRPTREDFENAANVLKELGVARYKEDFVQPVQVFSRDYFRIEGEEWDVVHVGGTKHIKVGAVVPP